MGKNNRIWWKLAQVLAVVRVIAYFAVMFCFYQVPFVQIHWLAIIMFFFATSMIDLSIRVMGVKENNWYIAGLGVEALIMFVLGGHVIINGLFILAIVMAISVFALSVANKKKRKS
jgi:hypothetical protein